MSSSAGHGPRIAVLWGHMSGYMHACLQALVDEGAEVLVCHVQADADAPFRDDAVTAGLRAIPWDGTTGGRELVRSVRAFAPDAVVINSWHRGPYRRVGWSLRGRALRILAMDNQWLGTAKQWLGVATRHLLLRPFYDAVILPGEAQAAFARKLGFPSERTIWGVYSCDHPRFARVAADRGQRVAPRSFLFVGRLVPEKAVDVLAEAYESYRATVDDPWPLLVAGTGPLDARLKEIPGVDLLGFVQPDELPRVFAQAGCLVLPSVFEPWAVVVHEATAAGLPVVCTEACGAAKRLVLDGYNGVVISPGRPDALTTALQRIHRANDETRQAMGRASSSLALQYTPERWARNLLARIPDLCREVGLAQSRPPSA